MKLKDAWLLTVLALAACGGPADPVDEAALDEPAAAADAVEPELVATDAAGSPTTGRFELGVHYLLGEIVPADPAIGLAWRLRRKGWRPEGAV